MQHTQRTMMGNPWILPNLLTLMNFDESSDEGVYVHKPKQVQCMLYNESLSMFVVSDTMHSISVYLTDECAEKFKSSVCGNVRNGFLHLESYHFTTVTNSLTTRDPDHLSLPILLNSRPFCIQCSQLTFSGGSDTTLLTAQNTKEGIIVEINTDEGIIDLKKEYKSTSSYVDMTTKLARSQFPNKTRLPDGNGRFLHPAAQINCVDNSNSNINSNNNSSNSGRGGGRQGKNNQVLRWEHTVVTPDQAMILDEMSRREVLKHPDVLRFHAFCLDGNNSKKTINPDSSTGFSNKLQPSSSIASSSAANDFDQNPLSTAYLRLSRESSKNSPNNRSSPPNVDDLISSVFVGDEQDLQGETQVDNQDLRYHHQNETQMEYDSIEALIFQKYDTNAASHTQVDDSHTQVDQSLYNRIASPNNITTGKTNLNSNSNIKSNSNSSSNNRLVGTPERNAFADKYHIFYTQQYSPQLNKEGNYVDYCNSGALIDAHTQIDKDTEMPKHLEKSDEVHDNNNNYGNDNNNSNNNIDSNNNDNDNANNNGNGNNDSNNSYDSYRNNNSDGVSSAIISNINHKVLDSAMELEDGITNQALVQQPSANNSYNADSSQSYGMNPSISLPTSSSGLALVKESSDTASTTMYTTTPSSSITTSMTAITALTTTSTTTSSSLSAPVVRLSKSKLPITPVVYGELPVGSPLNNSSLPSSLVSPTPSADRITLNQEANRLGHSEGNTASRKIPQHDSYPIFSSTNRSPNFSQYLSTAAAQHGGGKGSQQFETQPSFDSQEETDYGSDFLLSNPIGSCSQSQSTGTVFSNHLFTQAELANSFSNISNLYTFQGSGNKTAGSFINNTALSNVSASSTSNTASNSSGLNIYTGLSSLTSNSLYSSQRMKASFSSSLNSPPEHIQNISQPDSSQNQYYQSPGSPILPSGNDSNDKNIDQDKSDDNNINSNDNNGLVESNINVERNLASVGPAVKGVFDSILGLLKKNRLLDDIAPDVCQGDFAAIEKAVKACFKTETLTTASSKSAPAPKKMSNVKFPSLNVISTSNPNSTASQSSDLLLEQNSLLILSDMIFEMGLDWTRNWVGCTANCTLMNYLLSKRYRISIDDFSKIVNLVTMNSDRSTILKRQETLKSAYHQRKIASLKRASDDKNKWVYGYLQAYDSASLSANVIFESGLEYTFTEDSFVSNLILNDACDDKDKDKGKDTNANSNSNSAYVNDRMEYSKYQGSNNRSDGDPSSLAIKPSMFNRKIDPQHISEIFFDDLPTPPKAVKAVGGKTDKTTTVTSATALNSITSHFQEEKQQNSSSFAIGDQVEAMWIVEKKWYKATILRLKPDIKVRWEVDGSVTEGLQTKQIRNIIPTAPIADHNVFSSSSNINSNTNFSSSYNDNKNNDNSSNCNNSNKNDNNININNNNKNNNNGNIARIHDSHNINDAVGNSLDAWAESVSFQALREQNLLPKNSNTTLPSNIDTNIKKNSSNTNRMSTLLSFFENVNKLKRKREQESHNNATDIVGASLSLLKLRGYQNLFESIKKLKSIKRGKN